MKKSLIWTSVVSAMLVGAQANAAELQKVDTVSANALGKGTISATSFLKKNFKLNSNHSFKKIKSLTDAKGNTHYRYQQMYKGVPVWGEHVTQHNNVARSSDYFAGKILDGIEKDLGNNVQPKLDQSEILLNTKLKAETKLGKLSELQREKADLVIYFDKFTKKAVLSYHVDILAQNKDNQIIRHMFIVDANTGKILDNWNALQHFDVTGPGGNEKVGRYEYGTDFDALNGTDLGGGTCSLENENVRAVNLNHSTDTTINDAFEFSCSENTFKEINGAYSPINDAFYFGNVAFDMFDEWYDTAPLPIQLSMKVHYGSNVENAYWTGDSMLFGDGLNYFYPLVDINVSVHEISHGFTDFNSDLIYRNESGGMNEAFSDIAGEAGEYYWKGSVDWFVGGDVIKNGDGLRFFETPSNDGRSIDHYDDYYDGMDVHFSSGVYNRGYYLLSNTEGWDPRKAFDVFVLANQAYWTPNETMANGACGLLLAAMDLEYEWLDVYTAMSTVGAVCTGASGGVDSDLDGISDIGELFIGFDPQNPEDASQDFDGDGISNLAEMTSGYGAKDNDSDDDGLNDGDELLTHGTSVMNSDSDSDGMADGWEVQYGLNPLNAADASADLDEDGDTNLQEFQLSTDPTDPESYTETEISFSSIYDFESRDMSPFMPYSDSFSTFEITSSEAAGGLYSIQNEDINDSELAVTVLVADAEAGNLSFDLKTSTEGFWDYFELYVDGVMVYELSGENDWQTITYPLTAGERVIFFVYRKDGSVSSGDDTVWIDNVYYEGLAKDTDGDTMLDAFETHYGLDPEDAADAALDGDEDGLTNAEEFAAETNPTSADSDSDGLSDGDELNVAMTDPNNMDTDGDLILDGMEVDLELNPLSAADGVLDLDADGFTNTIEAKYGSNLNDATNVPPAHELIQMDFNYLNDSWQQAGDHSETWDVVSGALQAEATPNAKQAVISMTDVFYEGLLSFELTADTEVDVDMFQVKVNGTVVSEHSGVVSGEAVSVELDQGENTIELVYSKNELMSSSLDMVSIDNLVFMAPEMDSDNDGLTNSQEVDVYGTDPMVADTDMDGISDGDEVAKGTNPMSSDSDGDGVPDADDLFPLDASRWNSDEGGTIFYILMVLAGLGMARRRR